LQPHFYDELALSLAMENVHSFMAIVTKHVYDNEHIDKARL